MLADAAMKSNRVVSCDAARKAAIHLKRSEYSSTDDRVADETAVLSTCSNSEKCANAVL
jgi:hypothetical protein